ncbi:MAG: penicillin-binding transpeptidase domain-containing protein, partial [Candidatus Babeliales bacterium]|nr:penicillin-binding transpeptidase domain-containing protein [Candidatus Babeliales bacterium]
KTKVQGKPGTPITLTIDSDLQFIVTEELKAIMEQHDAKEGSALIINPKTGEILAMTNIPTFDPNNTDDLVNMEVTKNKIVTEAHELGSVIKACAALAALEDGAVTLDELIDCENKVTTYVDKRRINTVAQSVAGIIPFADVVAKSNNIGIAKVAKRLDTKIYDYYKKLGFGTKTGIPFPSEQKGLLMHPTQWSKQSIISLSYGYEISASLLQLARAFSIIANDGYDVKPKLIMDDAHIDYTTSVPLFSLDSTQAIKEIMKKRHANVKGYTLMSKTGTANILVNGKYDVTKNIFTCAGIVQKGDYQRVIVVFINQVAKKNVFAATIAAPLLEKLAKKLMIHDKMI